MDGAGNAVCLSAFRRCGFDVCDRPGELGARPHGAALAVVDTRCVNKVVKRGRVFPPPNGRTLSGVDCPGGVLGDGTRVPCLRVHGRAGHEQGTFQTSRGERGGLVDATQHGQDV